MHAIKHFSDDSLDIFSSQLTGVQNKFLFDLIFLFTVILAACRSIFIHTLKQFNGETMFVFCFAYIADPDI